MKVNLSIEINHSRLDKLTYEINGYDGLQPEEIEIRDWLMAEIDGIFEDLQEAPD